MNSDGDFDFENDLQTLFKEPEGYLPPRPMPTVQQYTIEASTAGGDRPVTLPLHLVGYSSGEAHNVWNGSRATARLFERDPSLVRGRTVLELGAGAGLPSLVAGALGARRVVVSDYPDAELVDTMRQNVDEWDRVLIRRRRIADVVVPAGIVWGADPGGLLDMLDEQEMESQSRINSQDQSQIHGQTKSQNKSQNKSQIHGQTKSQNKSQNKSQIRCYDVLILADLLFRHSAHDQLAKTITETLRRHPSSRAYVFFTSYRPWLRDRDLGFFDVVRARGLVAEQVSEERLERPLFPDDPGDVEVQKTVSGWVVRWPEDEEGVRE